MDVVEDVSELRRRVGAERCAGRTIGLVPTMGYLHAGHRSLLDAARRDNDMVVASIFVNPTQFGPGEDLASYPRDLKRDHAVLDAAGTDLLFLPSAADMYPDGAGAQAIWVEPGALAGNLCGASRPGHFRGVATVVTKLLNMVQPDTLYLGQKDVQQAAILRRMVRDLAFPVSVRVLPTVREPDGLALSSRNAYLTPEERAEAPALKRALDCALAMIGTGERDVARLVAGMEEVIRRDAPDGRIDYISVVDAATLQPVVSLQGDVLIALAVYLGKARLIDNAEITIG
ncbi:MAG TPA: pantoate--beta-alanine ligase [Chloroflexota bacterium]|nr:pantoate--beta-alanine ligase [Chloroflexota bacterium]